MWTEGAKKNGDENKDVKSAMILREKKNKFEGNEILRGETYVKKERIK